LEFRLQGWDVDLPERSSAPEMDVRDKCGPGGAIRCDAERALAVVSFFFCQTRSAAHTHGERARDLKERLRRLIRFFSTGRGARRLFLLMQMRPAPADFLITRTRARQNRRVQLQLRLHPAPFHSLLCKNENVAENESAYCV
jgi:hypothetical protein